MVTTTATDLPTLPGGFNYPPPTVPPTAGAPYLQASNLPEGSVFIFVGALLALVALLILLWRIAVAWSINRSFKRPVADAIYTPLMSREGEARSRPTTSAGPGHHRAQSSHGMSDLTLPRNFSQSANSTLFFSPTAEAARYSSMQRPPSQHLPTGNYKTDSETFK